MPTYEYRCEACGHEFEREQRISDDPVKNCPKCGKAKAKRMITQGNFILKGGGWYSDLYSSASSSSSSTSSAPKADSTSTSTETKSSTSESPAKSETKSKKKAAS